MLSAQKISKPKTAPADRIATGPAFPDKYAAVATMKTAQDFHPEKLSETMLNPSPNLKEKIIIKADAAINPATAGFRALITVRKVPVLWNFI